MERGPKHTKHGFTDVPNACPKCTSGGTVTLDGGQGRCMMCGTFVELSPAELHRARRADESYARHENSGRSWQRKAGRRCRSTQLLLFSMRRIPRSMPDAHTMAKCALAGVPLGVAMAAAVCVSHGARLLIGVPGMVPLALELAPLPGESARIASGAGFAVTSVLGRRAAVWVRA